MAPRMRGNKRRGNNSRGAPRARLAVEQKHAISVAYTRYVPPQNPLPRELAGRWRRVVQITKALTQDSTSAWKGIANVLPNEFFLAAASLSGFDAFYLHRVAVWSGVVVPASGQTVWPTLVVHLADFQGNLQWPSYIDHAPAYNHRARIGLNVPSHLAGPYLQNSTKRWLDIEAYQEGATGSFTVQTVVIEIDATFV